MSTNVDTYREQVLHNVTDLVNSLNSLELLGQIEYMCNELRLSQGNPQMPTELFAHLMEVSEQQYRQGNYVSHEDMLQEIEQW